MTEAQDILFYLLQSSLGTIEAKLDWSAITKSDWQSLIDISFDQGVAAIAVDGLQKFYEANPGLELEIDSEELEDLKYEWFGEVMQAEDDYSKHCKIVNTICQTYIDNGFMPILLKGIGLGLDYPIPTHRICGDLDIFLADGKSLEGDMMITEMLGAKVTKSKIGHHSHWAYKGLLVENHYELSNSYFGGEKSRQFERELQTLIASDVRKPYEECPYYLPSANFNAVFLLWHLGTHFCSGEINLKQLCDLLMFLKCHHSEIDWPKVQRIWKQYGMENFANAIGSVLVKYLAMPEKLIPGMVYYDAIALRIMDDILTGIKGPRKGFLRILKYPRNAWKYRLVSGRSWIYPMLESIWMHIAHSGDLVERYI